MTKTMKHRITIMISDDVMKKLRNEQSRLIKETSENVSFSSLVEDVLDRGLKK